MRKVIGCALALVLGLASPASAASLTGSTVTATLTPLLPYHYQITPFASPQTVGDGIEFSGIYKNTGFTGFVLTFNISVDVSEKAVRIVTRSGDNISNPYSGIASISLNSLSGLFPKVISTNFTCANTDCAFDIRNYTTSASNITLNLNRLIDQQFVFNFAAPAVPEPATWLTMVLGFGVVGGALRARQIRLAHG